MKNMVVLLVLLVLVGCGTTEAEKPTMSIDETSIAFNEALKNQAYESMENDFAYDKKMRSFLNENKISSVFEQLELGQLKEQQVSVRSEKDGYTIIATPTIFENVSYDVNLVFDAEGLIVGFNVGAFTGVEEGVEGEEGGEGTEGIEEADLVSLGTAHHLSFSNGQFELLMSDYSYSKQMLDVVSESWFKQIHSDLDLGKLLDVKEGFAYVVSGFMVVSIPVNYENKSFNYNVVFDQSREITGLNFAEYQEKVVESKSEDLVEVVQDAQVNGAPLPGILTLPSSEGSYPCVILVHGSGASDKDETILQNKPFRDIAWGLAERGIASYRYDKRGFVYPEKLKTATDLTIYDETVNDVTEIYKMVIGLEGVNVDEVYVLGHSLGGYAIPLIAETINAKGYVIMAGNVRPLEVLIEEQVVYLTGLDGELTADEKTYIDQIKAQIAKLTEIDQLKDEDVVLGAYKAYWAFLETYEPLEKAEQIDNKVLLLQGERDYQVTMTDYNLWHERYGEKDNWSFRTYPSLNHLMMAGEGAPSNADYQKASHVAEVVIDDIADWIRE